MGDIEGNQASLMDQGKNISSSSCTYEPALPLVPKNFMIFLAVVFIFHFSNMVLSQLSSISVFSPLHSSDYFPSLIFLSLSSSSLFSI